eukprot:CAMPEP_0117682160 /NCGR_PEP_ID=MMETSP0804-20121206/19464_1 /TAXON_ID=1074897 /ORGANISM="Tetraselmis astigmatica, Strain CCMP880" /LENGTH=56 /DNA_ID=CAMNT_0005492159 /DNA_START=442 /DNA_END=609 /DNA_ORIENTATION=-
MLNTAEANTTSATIVPTPGQPAGILAGEKNQVFCFPPRWAHHQYVGAESAECQLQQ